MIRTIAVSVALIASAAMLVWAGARSASGVVFPVTPYDADVNKDAHVNSTDMLNVAKNFGKAVPTATSAPTQTPVATPTETPTPAAYSTYVVTRLLDANGSQSPWRTQDVTCTGNDEPVGWSAESGGATAPLMNIFPIRLAEDGSSVRAWRFNYVDQGNYSPAPTVHLICLTASSGELPITHVAMSNGFGTSPFNVPCPIGENAVGWGELALTLPPTPIAAATTLVGWTFTNSGYNTMYAVCLGASSRYVAPITYVGPCDAEDVTTAYLNNGAHVCLDNPPVHN